MFVKAPSRCREPAKDSSHSLRRGAPKHTTLEARQVFTERGGELDHTRRTRPELIFGSAQSGGSASADGAHSAMRSTAKRKPL